MLQIHAVQFLAGVVAVQLLKSQVVGVHVHFAEMGLAQVAVADVAPVGGTPLTGNVVTARIPGILTTAA